MDRYKETVFGWVDRRMGDLSDWNQTIWHYGETALREYKSAAWYVARLKQEGFEVEAGTGGMPTAFRATWSEPETNRGRPLSRPRTLARPTRERQTPLQCDRSGQCPTQPPPDCPPA